MAENGSFAALEKWVPPFRSQLLSLSLTLPVAHDQTLSLPKPQPNRANERASEQGKKREPENEGGREAGCYWAHSTQRRRRRLFRPPARSVEHSPSPRRGYRQLESWHQTTMGGGEAGREEKKPDGRATAAKCLLVQSASRPPSTRFSTVVIRHLRRHRRRRRRSHPVLTLDAFMHND